MSQAEPQRGSEAGMGPVATSVLFENDDVKVWEMKLKPGELCGLHRHTLDYILYIIEGARIGVESPGSKPFRFDVEQRGTYFIPAGGVESAHNVGDTTFREALFEIKRPVREGAKHLGFMAAEALAGEEPRPGVRRILENDRVRVTEASLAPGEESGERYQSHDAVVFVVEGGRVKSVEREPTRGEWASESELQDNAVIWQPRGAYRNAINVGNRRFRQVMVELK